MAIHQRIRACLICAQSVGGGEASCRYYLRV
jgi:hypothetical protein